MQTNLTTRTARSKMKSSERSTATSQPDLARVSERIASAVLEFCQGAHLFHMAQLNHFVEARVGVVAPDSPARVLRQLRQAGKVRCRVLSRAESLYEILPSVPTQTEFPQFFVPQGWRDDG